MSQKNARLLSALVAGNFLNLLFAHVQINSFAICFMNSQPMMFQLVVGEKEGGIQAGTKIKMENLIYFGSYEFS